MITRLRYSFIEVFKNNKDIFETFFKNMTATYDNIFPDIAYYIHEMCHISMQRLYT